MGDKWKKFKILYEASIKSRNKNDINVWIAKPQNSLFQKINKLYISKRPKFIYEEKRNKILYFKFQDKNQISLKIGIEARLQSKKMVIKNQGEIKNNKLKKFSSHLKGEKFLEQTPQIKKLTKQITKNDKSVLEKIISITNFLKNNFKHVYPIKNRGVKNLNLKNLKGDCGEVGGLFVTMCRILKIPAINKTGYVIYYDELNNIYEHGWTSAYINNTGWLEIDPLAENIKKYKNQYIYEQKNYFLTVCEGFNIKIKPPILKSHKIDYWKNLGLPITKNSSQIIQPLIFSSENKLNFKENIKLTK